MRIASSRAYRAIALHSLILVALATPAAAQTIREKDPQPFERPKPLIVTHGDTRVILQAIQKILQQDGFTVDLANWEDGELQASRADTHGGDRNPALDKVLIWLEGGLSDRAQVRVYFDYGRYETFFGSPDLQRALVTTSEARQRIGTVRDHIASATFGAP
jgi:hypothetical protein